MRVDSRLQYSEIPRNTLLNYGFLKTIYRLKLCKYQYNQTYLSKFSLQEKMFPMKKLFITPIQANLRPSTPFLYKNCIKTVLNNHSQQYFFLYTYNI